MILPQGWSKWCSDSIPFGIQITTHFHRIAWSSFINVIILCWFNQKCILAFRFTDTIYSWYVWVDEYVWTSIHKFPHSWEDWYLRPLPVMQGKWISMNVREEEEKRDKIQDETARRISESGICTKKETWRRAREEKKEKRTPPCSVNHVEYTKSKP